MFDRYWGGGICYIVYSVIVHFCLEFWLHILNKRWIEITLTTLLYVYSRCLELCLKVYGKLYFECFLFFIFFFGPRYTSVVNFLNLSDAGVFLVSCFLKLFGIVGIGVYLLVFHHFPIFRFKFPTVEEKVFFFLSDTKTIGGKIGRGRGRGRVRVADYLVLCSSSTIICMYIYIIFFFSLVHFP